MFTDCVIVLGRGVDRLIRVEPIRPDGIGRRRPHDNPRGVPELDRAIGDRGLARVEKAVTVGVVVDEATDHVASQEHPRLETLDLKVPASLVRSPGKAGSRRKDHNVPLIRLDPRCVGGPKGTRTDDDRGRSRHRCSPARTWRERAESTEGEEAGGKRRRGLPRRDQATGSELAWHTRRASVFTPSIRGTTFELGENYASFDDTGRKRSKGQLSLFTMPILTSLKW